MRNSSVVQAILQTLKLEKSHLTAQAVYEQIRGQLPAVNPSTVYRALERLAEAGEISVSDLGTGAAVYETVTEEVHHHLVCQKCQQVVTMEPEQVSRFFRAVERQAHFKILTNHLVLFGVCEGCQKAGE
jgi:Fur family transcriptional regulator, ferric uptake regulator